MMKIKLLSVLFRLGLFAVLISAAVGVYAFRSRLPLAKFGLNPAAMTEKIKGLGSAVNLDTTVLVTEAQKKLVDRQPIIDDNASSESGEVAGVSTTLTDQTRVIVQQAANAAAQAVSNLPKDQAAKITRQVCEQIVAELEKDATPTPVSNEGQ